MRDPLLCCRLSSFAYLDVPADIAMAVATLGLDFKGLFGEASECQAIVCADAAGDIVAIRGTQFVEQTSLRDILANFDGRPLALKDGGVVHRGYFAPLEEAWPDIETVLGAGALTITGHSMGGARAHLARHFAPHAEIVSFGAPKCAGTSFYARAYSDGYQPLRFVNERDFAPAWPFLGPWEKHPPGAAVWLRHGSAIAVPSRGGVNTEEADHPIERYHASLASAYRQEPLPAPLAALAPAV
jgi:hypothetical protein